MPNLVENTQSSNYTLKNILRTGLNPLSAMIGLSMYYGRHLGSPILGSLNALLFGKKLSIDIWSLNQPLTLKNQILHSSKKILLGLGTIGLVNYSKFSNSVFSPIEPSSTTLSPLSTTTIPWTTLIPHNTTTIPLSTTTIPLSTTTVDPWPPMLMQTNNLSHQLDNSIIDLDTFISLNIFGIANIIAGITEFIPYRFKNTRKLTNMTSGACLISSGVAMGINNNFDNAYTIPTIIAGVSEIIHNLIPIKTIHTNNIELEQNTEFNNETARLINACEVQSNRTMGSMDTLSLDSENIIWDRSNPYQSTIMHL